jgi:hypothetical protein
MKGNFNWNGGSGSCFVTSCLIRQPFAFCAFDRNRCALHVVNTELGAGVHAEVKLGQITVKMLGVDVLVNTDDATLRLSRPNGQLTPGCQ